MTAETERVKPVLRPGLRWALGATALLTAIALCFDPRQGAVREAGTAPAGTSAGAGQAGVGVAAAPAAAAQRLPPLPRELVRTSFDAPARDLFAMRMPAVPPAVPVPQAAASVPVLAAPAAPPPPLPVPTAGFLGRVLSPDGQWQIYLREGNQTILARPGAMLGNGFVVEALVPAGESAPRDAGAAVAEVLLFHAARDHRVRLVLPTEP